MSPLMLALTGCSPIANQNVGGTGTLVLDAPPGWTVTNEGLAVNVEGPGVMMAINNLKRSAYARFEHNERQRYSGIAKEQGIAVAEGEVSLGECVGTRWLAKLPDKYSGHYLLRHERGFVYVALFRAETEKSVQEVEAALATVSIQP
jgi:hypothetical protein